MSSNFISASMVETLTGKDRTFEALRGFSYNLLNGIFVIFYATQLKYKLSHIPYTSRFVYIRHVVVNK